MRTLLILAMLLSPLALADSIEPSHDCNKPDVPYEFQDQYERDQFEADVEEYKNCITDFVEEQQDAIRKHKSAADNAIEEWNSFARST
jgi:LmbE family N-acetylglucosaminyl deacetylase